MKAEESRDMKWHVVEVEERDGVRLDVVDDKGKTVAQWVGVPRRLYGTADESRAKLIAAAPELLDAIKNIICHRCENRIGWDVNGKCRECDPARLAISKAEGH